jgi:hypothetical protein
MNDSGGSWSPPVSLPSVGLRRAGGPQIAVSAAGHAHIVFDGSFTGGEDYDVFYSENSGGSFSTPLNLTSDAGLTISWGPDIALGQTGDVHIVFTDSPWPDYRIFYMHNDGSGFGGNVEIAHSAVLDIDLHGASIALDSGGDVHIGFFKQNGLTDEYNYKYTNNSGGTFAEPTVVANDAIGCCSSGENLVLDAADKVHIAVHGIDQNGPMLSYHTNASGSWVSENVAPGRREPSIAVDGDGKAHITSRPHGSFSDIFYYTNKGVVSGTECFIQDITMSLTYKGNGKPANRGWTATATVLIQDDQGNPVFNATVSGDWSGLTTDSDTGTTGSDGRVSLNSDRIDASGTFTFTATGVSHSSLTYNPALNVTISESISTSSKRALDEMIATAVPSEFQLFQNHPNPFNPETVILFAVPQASYVELTVYNTRGQVIRHLLSQDFSAGEHAIKWDGRDQSGKSVSSGVYLYEIQAGDFRQVKKMSLLR